MEERHSDELISACTAGILDEVKRLTVESQDILGEGDAGVYLKVAVEAGQASVVDYLLVSGIVKSSVVVKPGLHGKDTTPLHLASEKGHLDVVKALLKHGAAACIDSGDLTPLMRATMKGHHTVVSHLINSGAMVSKKDKFSSTALHLACVYGHLNVVSVLLATPDCIPMINDLNDHGRTPLMSAAECGHHTIARELILKEAKVSFKNHSKNTALHFAARSGHIQCVFLLIEYGGNVHAKNNNSKTPLSYTSLISLKSIQNFRKFRTRKSVCVIGNAYSGKSTLISSLQAERTTTVGKFVNKFRRVSDMRHRTAGIEPVDFSSRKYGEVVFFDFAGQHEYHGPHEAFLEPLINENGSTVTLIFVVNATQNESVLSSQLHRWLQPVSVMCSATNPVRVIVVGSYADQVVSKPDVKDKFTKLTAEIMSYRSFSFQGFCLMDCRKPESSGIRQLCHHLSQTPYPSLMVLRTYSIFSMISHMKATLDMKVIQQDQFFSWIKKNSNIFPALPPVEEVCRDVAATGHYMYIPNKSNPQKSCLILDPPAILKEVYGKLFSFTIDNAFGLVQLSKLFPATDLDMITNVLTSFEFCIPIEADTLKADLSKLVNVAEVDSDWVFFPSLVSNKRPHLLPFNTSSTNLCWHLETVKPHMISPRLLQTIMLRLSAHFVFRHEPSPGVVVHCCDIWWNGIVWGSTKGVDVAVQIVDNNIIQVIGNGSPGSILCNYLASVVADILESCQQLSSGLVFTASIVRTDNIQKLFSDPRGISPNECFPVSSILHSISNGDKYILSLPNPGFPERCSLEEIFGGTPPNFETIKRMLWDTDTERVSQLKVHPGIPKSEFNLISGLIYLT